ncbi:MAG: toll/interleukin-1 receptor domain-containing protein [Defluviitaleaceae bacterium]|nr:toll/interleukin-1 receptor domain-containing protein [Defluviitaleaceae bacterium]MCL2240734.1 toll/interleukin-1 receptor domain-containing protein [Defluviitaleaceae bacterium]
MQIQKRYTVFISRSNAEADIAAVICNELNAAFRMDRVNFIHINIGLYGGKNWREAILEQVGLSDASMFLFTPRYIESPWALAEYAVFWIQENKPTYLFKLGDADIDKVFGVVDPNIQVADLLNREESENFFNHISSIVNKDGTPSPLHKLDGFIAAVKEAYEKCEQKRLGRHNRLYALVKNHVRWAYTMHTDGESLSAVMTRQVKVRCLGKELNYINVFKDAIRPQISCGPCNGEDGCKISVSTLGEGAVQASGIKTPGQCNWQVKFVPALRQGQEVELEIKVTIPAYKPATFEATMKNIQAKLQTKMEIANTYPVYEQTDELIYEISFPPHYPIEPKTPLALSKKDAHSPYKEDAEETEAINAPGCTWVKGQDGAWSIVFTRNHPPVQMAYQFAWVPPGEGDLPQGKGRGDTCEHTHAVDA